jgi:hypothetical protein
VAYPFVVSDYVAGVWKTGRVRILMPGDCEGIDQPVVVRRLQTLPRRLRQFIQHHFVASAKAFFAKKQALVFKYRLAQSYIAASCGRSRHEEGSAYALK